MLSQKKLLIEEWSLDKAKQQNNKMFELKRQSDHITQKNDLKKVPSDNESLDSSVTK